jgi:putative transposase
MVWTKQNRGRYDRRGQRYPSDLINEEWAALEPLLPVPKGFGRPRRYSLREITNGIRYVLRYGIPWDAMPKDSASLRASAMIIGGCCPTAVIWSGSIIIW